MPPHWYLVNIGGQPGDVERAVKRTLAAVRADKKARLVITVSSLTGPGELWSNQDFCERHSALGRRLAERVPPECAALLAGRPDEARRLVLGPGAD
ncbi:MAG TPA: hypothetical protein VEX11_17010, partial [Acetobacteraceae bacterium]|nr:hypothetical protein [Acetobacteraceae bacterium]